MDKINFNFKNRTAIVTGGAQGFGLDIAKSMAWSTKADVGLTVYRGDSNVEIHCTKARWNWNARLGQADLKFNPVNGRYEEIEQEEDNFDWEF